jgi:hypothetical protein
MRVRGGLFHSFDTTPTTQHLETHCNILNPNSLSGLHCVKLSRLVELSSVTVDLETHLQSQLNCLPGFLASFRFLFATDMFYTQAATKVGSDVSKPKGMSRRRPQHFETKTNPDVSNPAPMSHSCKKCVLKHVCHKINLVFDLETDNDIGFDTLKHVQKFYIYNLTSSKIMYNVSLSINLVKLLTSL